MSIFSMDSNGNYVVDKRARKPSSMIVDGNTVSLHQAGPQGSGLFSEDADGNIVANRTTPSQGLIRVDPNTGQMVMDNSQPPTTQGLSPNTIASLFSSLRPVLHRESEGLNMTPYFNPTVRYISSEDNSTIVPSSPSSKSLTEGEVMANAMLAESTRLSSPSSKSLTEGEVMANAMLAESTRLSSPSNHTSKVDKYVNQFNQLPEDILPVEVNKNLSKAAELESKVQDIRTPINLKPVKTKDSISDSYVNSLKINSIARYLSLLAQKSFNYNNPSIKQIQEQLGINPDGSPLI